MKPAAAGVPDFTTRPIPASPSSARQLRVRFSHDKRRCRHRRAPRLAPHERPDRFYNLVRSGFYDGVRSFGVIRASWRSSGSHGDTGVTAAWRPRVIFRTIRCGHQRARHGDLRDRGTGDAHHADLHQFRRQQPARRERVRAVRAGSSKVWKWWTHCTAGTARARPAGAARISIGSMSRGEKYLAASSQARQDQQGNGRIGLGVDDLPQPPLRLAVG